MGLRDFFLEDTRKTEEDALFEMEDGMTNLPEVVIESVNTDTLIDDIYAQNDLLDKTKSIFKVEELIDSLPKEMVTATKKASVIAILGSFGLTTVSVVDDGTKRINTLLTVGQSIANTCAETVASKENEIEELKKKIASLQADIAMEEEVAKKSTEAINKEAKRIDELIEFVGGEV